MLKSKRFIGLLLCIFIFAFAFVGCSDEITQQSEGEAENTESEDIIVPPIEDTYPSEHSDNLLIFQVYGTGGKTDAAVSHSFVELYNPTENDIDLNGYSVQYAKSKTSWVYLS